MLKLTDVTWLYQHLPMRFTLSVRQGEIIAVLGPSGAGKSTLLNLIAGFLQPASGSIAIDNRDFTNAPPAKRPVSMLFQENNLFTHLTVWQNIALGMHPGLKLNVPQRQKLEVIAAQMGIAEFLDRLPGELSGGQRQRVALARCLVREQPILLLDEPFSALDPALRQEMLALVQDVCQRQQLTMLMVSHSIEDAARIAPRSVVIAEGRILWDGKTEELLMVWPGSNASPADMQAVEDAMNEIIGEKVDAKVKLQIIEWGAYNDQTNLMLSSGEKLDMVFLMSNIREDGQRGQLYPINELRETNAPGAYSEMEQKRQPCTKTLYRVSTERGVELCQKFF